MFERFTAHARRSVVMAQEEARRMNHNYIGTEHVLLGLLRQPDGLAYGVLEGVGVTLDGTREQVAAMVGMGKREPKGHIPFTPRAKKTLELALREALGLHNNYIGTEHILLGLIREGEGVAAQILRRHADLLAIRASMLDLVPLGDAEGEGDTFLDAAGNVLRRVRERITGREAVSESEMGTTSAARALPATPAADATLAKAARLAGTEPVGSHHLLLAALADPDSAAARVFASLGVDLDQAKEALRTADVTGTSDEPPEAAGRRQMVVQVSGDQLTIVVTDPVIVAAGRAALQAVNPSSGTNETEAGEEEEASEGSARKSATATVTTIRGDNPAAASFAAVWQALHASLTMIAGTATPADIETPANTAPSADATSSADTESPAGEVPPSAAA